MGVSTRHTRRILAAYREKGAAAIAHGNRGRRPANATPSTLAIEAVRLARTRYAGVNHTHLSELLREREGIDIGRDTLRAILTNAGVNSPRRRRPPKHRVRRQRMPREGMLIRDNDFCRPVASSQLPNLSYCLTWMLPRSASFTSLCSAEAYTSCFATTMRHCRTLRWRVRN